MNTPNFTRRQFLRSAGGITFLALTPVGRGLFAASQTHRTDLPLFTALPYIQPGNNSRLIEGKESMMICWQTELRPAEFQLTYGNNQPGKSQASILRNKRWSGADDDKSRFNYAAVLENLRLGTRYYYRVTANDETILEGYFTTRKPRGRNIRFVSFGDNAHGAPSDHAIAYQAYQTHPDFVMNTGDNVYEHGLDHQYAEYFFPVYNADQPALETGAPLLRSVPFYTVIANHDVACKDENHHWCADFDAEPDSLAFFTNFYLPLNGPDPVYPTPMHGDEKRLKAFKQCAAKRFPRMVNYSFDYGDAHFLCLDSNLYLDPTDTAFQTWIEVDLKNTDANWKFVVYHHPAFNAGHTHYQEQHMRVLSPLLERLDVDIVLHGHEHTYQRPRPLRFAPQDSGKAKQLHQNDRRVPGIFTIDRDFDGKTITRPKGLLYITTGAGGKNLYDAEDNNNPARWLHEDDNNADYVARFISDRYSFSLFEIDGDALTMSQIDQNGETVDHIRITKS